MSPQSAFVFLVGAFTVPAIPVQAGSIIGQLIDENGQPIANARVSVHLRMSSPFRGRSLPPPNGH